MKKGLLISVIVSIMVLGQSVSAQTAITAVTENSYEESALHMEGHYLVWQGRNGDDWEVFLYNVVTKEPPVQITNNKFDDLSPKTDGNHVVWLGFSQPNGPGGDVFLSGGGIFLYDISSGLTTKITNDGHVNSPPQIADGRVVWASRVIGDSVEPGEILLYDIETGVTEQVTDSVLDDSSPLIGDGGIIWVRVDETGASGLYVRYPGSTQSAPVPDGFVWTDSPENDGDLSVLTRYDGGDREVFAYSACFGVYERITDNNAEDRSPVTSVGNIAWVQGKGQASEIFVASYNADLDEDQIPYSDDDCPCENATGFDSDQDGCMDTINGLTAVIQTLEETGLIEEEMRNSLISHTRNAQRFEDTENICNAIGQLETLVSKINQQREKKISHEAADEVISYADSVIAWYSALLREGESC